VFPPLNSRYEGLVLIFFRRCPLPGPPTLFAAEIPRRFSDYDPMLFSETTHPTAGDVFLRAIHPPLEICPNLLRAFVLLDGLRCLRLFFLPPFFIMGSPKTKELFSCSLALLLTQASSTMFLCTCLNMSDLLRIPLNLVACTSLATLFFGTSARIMILGLIRMFLVRLRHNHSFSCLYVPRDSLSASHFLRTAPYDLGETRFFLVLSPRTHAINIFLHRACPLFLTSRFPVDLSSFPLPPRVEVGGRVLVGPSPPFTSSTRRNGSLLSLLCLARLTQSSFMFHPTGLENMQTKASRPFLTVFAFPSPCLDSEAGAF